MKIEDYYGWSTHIPLLQALLTTFKPEFILELGIGMYSTPMFIDYTPLELICIDNDAGWINQIKPQYSFKDGYKIILHDLGSGISVGTFLHQLTQDQKDGIVHYYKELAETLRSNSKSPKMLFVDNFTCCRTLAINTLYRNFDIIVYHDCEPAGIAWYEYYFVEEIKKEFNSYMLKTPANWTGCFIRRDLDQRMLNSNISQYINIYCIKNDLSNKHVYLEKEY